MKKANAFKNNFYTKTHYTHFFLCIDFVGCLFLKRTVTSIHQAIKLCTFFMGTSISTSLWVVSETISHCDLPFLNAYSTWNCTNQSTTWFHVTLYCGLVSCIDFNLFLECLLLNCKCSIVRYTTGALKVPSDSRNTKQVEKLKNVLNQLRFW